MKWVALPYSEPYTEETKCNEVKIYLFSCNQEYYTIKRIAFKNAWESSIIFQSFLYASIISVESYARTLDYRS